MKTLMTDFRVEFSDNVLEVKVDATGLYANSENVFTLNHLVGLTCFLVENELEYEDGFRIQLNNLISTFVNNYGKTIEEIVDRTQPVPRMPVDMIDSQLMKQSTLGQLNQDYRELLEEHGVPYSPGYQLEMPLVYDE